MKTLFSILIVLSFISVANAQEQTTAQCVATIRARAGMTFNAAEAQKLCEKNSVEVANCVVTQMQGSRFSGNLDSSIKTCRSQWLTTADGQSQSQGSATTTTTATPSPTTSSK